MCGIVCTIGASKSVNPVLNALDLLTYRAPDSSGVAVLDAQGEMVVRRAVGTSKDLQAKMEMDPLPRLPEDGPHIVLGHGRWAMVGAVTEHNAHPLSDRSGTRVICENGSHDATLMLSAMRDQEVWWRRRGVPEGQPIHRSQNTSEVLVCEWERLRLQLDEGAIPADCEEQVSRLAAVGITDREEVALRLAVWRWQEGNAHACAFYSSHRPDTLFITSHHKSVNLIIRRRQDGPPVMMVASDINAALMLWTPEEVAEAAEQIDGWHNAARSGRVAAEVSQQKINELTSRFSVDVVCLDHRLNGGAELFVRIDLLANAQATDSFVLEWHLSNYAGQTLTATTQREQLNPAMVGKRGFASYTESHIAEIPDVLHGLRLHYARAGTIDLRGPVVENKVVGAGLHAEKIFTRFGEGLLHLRRLLLIGEGSSWRDAQCAALLFRQLLPAVLVNVYRPVELLNLGPAIDPQHDLAVEISWSGTTDAVLKVDSWLHELDVLRIVITGRPQSDLGRRGLYSAGTLDVMTGVEVSVATVKGFAAILFMLDLLAGQMAIWGGGSGAETRPDALMVELIEDVPATIRPVIEDQSRRVALRALGRRCARFNKVAVVGNSPVDIESELKIEELAQVVARAIDFQSAGLRAMIERSAWASDDAQRILFIINATTPAAQQAARPVIHYLHELNVFAVVHTTSHLAMPEWERLENLSVFFSPAVSPPLQSLVDVPFFFDLAVALAYGRGLTAEEIDRPRNLAKSVTTTGAHRRVQVEQRPIFPPVSMADFAQNGAAWNRHQDKPAISAFRATIALRAALAVLADPLPAGLSLQRRQHLVIVTASEEFEIGAQMSGVVWQELHGVDLTVFRRFLPDTPRTRADSYLLRIVRAGAFLALADENTIQLPTDLNPLQGALLTAVYLCGLAIRLARQQDRPVEEWARGLAQLSLLLARLYQDDFYSRQIRTAMKPLVDAGYDKVQIIGGGQDFVAASGLAHLLQQQGIMAEELYTDSAWHGPLATVGGPDPEHDTLIVILATDPLFQAAALVDTQVYRTRQAQVILLVPEGNENRTDVQDVQASAVLAIPAGPRPYLPMINTVWGAHFAAEFASMLNESGS